MEVSPAAAAERTLEPRRRRPGLGIRLPSVGGSVQQLRWPAHEVVGEARCGWLGRSAGGRAADLAEEEERFVFGSAFPEKGDGRRFVLGEERERH